jgi:hypothetical protein
MNIRVVEARPDPFEIQQQAVQFGLRPARSPMGSHVTHEIAVGMPPSTHLFDKTAERLCYGVSGVCLGIGIRMKVIDEVLVKEPIDCLVAIPIF